MFKRGDKVRSLITISADVCIGDVGTVVDYKPNKKEAFSLTVKFEGDNIIDEYPFYEEEVEKL